jgi:prepilin-type N-terminal cleavage/methylation domain-containing protein
VRSPARTTQRGARRDRARARGFTLIEILVVMLVVSMLMGVGVGFLSRLDTSLDQAIAVVRSEVRHAREVARNRSSPAHVVFEKSRDGYPAKVHSVVLVPVAHWHFEDQTGTGSPNVAGTLGGRVVDQGRFGKCLAVDPDIGRAGLTVPTQGLTAFDLSVGFKVRVDVWLDSDQAATVITLPKTFSLGVKSGLLPTAELGLEPSGVGPRLTGPRPLLPNTWTTLEISYDRIAFRLAVDGIDVASIAATARPFQDLQASLVVSDPGSPVAGRIDECFLLAYEQTAPILLQPEVEIVEAPAVLQFDSQGEPDAGMHPGPVRIVVGRDRDRKTLTLEPGGILR